MSELGPKFYSEGKQELRKIILENQGDSIVGGMQGSDAVLLSMATGLNVALIGEPGGGKSELSSASYRIIGGIEESDIAKVPHTADLTAERLIGATASTSKRTTVNGETKHEEIQAELNPILKEDTKVIWMDEINRVAPFAINGVLGAIENGKVVTDAGMMSLKSLLWVISAANPHNKSHSTFRLDPAVISRHPIGMILGDEMSHEKVDEPDDILDAIIMENWEPKPETVNPVIDLRELDTIRAAVDGVRIPENSRTLARHLAGTMLSGWRENDILEAKGRAAKQFSRAARGLGVLRNATPAVTEADLRDAAALVSCSRLALGARLEYSELQSAIHDIAYRS